MQVDVKVSPGADGPRIRLSYPDRTSVVPLDELLGSLRSLTSEVADAAAEREHGAGREVSCKAGCGACCRQLVPISRAEAREMPRLIAGLGEAHRRRVMARFDEALRRLRASPLWERLERRATLSTDERNTVSIEYFRLGIACPFLEDESCSIHPVRPLICREYLVTSPAANCSRLTAKGVKIDRVPLAAAVFGAVGRVEAKERGELSTLPLVLAPFLSLDEGKPGKTAPEWMSLLLQEIRAIRNERLARLQASDTREPSE